MDNLKLKLVKKKYIDARYQIEQQIQEAKMAGAKRSDISAMEAYSKTYQMFIFDLTSLAR